MQTLDEWKNIKLLESKLSMWLFSSNVLAYEKHHIDVSIKIREKFMPFAISTLNFQFIQINPWTCTIITRDPFVNLALSCQGWTKGVYCNNNTSLRID